MPIASRRSSSADDDAEDEKRCSLGRYNVPHNKVAGWPRVCVVDKYPADKGGKEVAARLLSDWSIVVVDIMVDRRTPLEYREA